MKKFFTILLTTILLLNVVAQVKTKSNHKESHNDKELVREKHELDRKVKRSAKKWNKTHKEDQVSEKFFGNGESEENETDGMMEAMQQELELTKDPATGEVPRYKLVQAREYADQLYNSLNNVNGIIPVANINWEERGPNTIGGRTRILLFDKKDTSNKKVWTASVGGGLFTCNDITAATPTWNKVNDFFGNLAICAMVQHPTNPDTMYFGTGEGFFNIDAIRGAGIWRSSNNGTTWTQLASSMGGSVPAAINRLAITNSGVLYAATSQGLYRSSNGGNSWTAVLTTTTTPATTSNTGYDIKIAINGDMYYSSLGQIWKYNNSTSTWSNVSPAGTYRRAEIACAPSDSNFVYLLIENTSNALGFFYSSNNKGATWTSRTVPKVYDQASTANTELTRGQAWYDLALTVDPFTPTTVYAGGIEYVKSTDTGATYKQITAWSLYAIPAASNITSAQYMHSDHHILVFRPGSNSYAIFGNDGGIYRSTNMTNNWPSLPSYTEINTNYNVTQYYACAFNPIAGNNQAIAGAQDNGTHRFVSKGINPGAEVNGGDGAYCHIDHNQPQYQFAAYTRNNLCRSVDSGKTFTFVIGNNGGSFINPTDYDHFNNKMYCGAGSNAFFRWENPQTGNTFNSITATAFGSNVTHVSVSPTVNNRVYFGISNGRIMRVDSANLTVPTFTDLRKSGMPTTPVSCICVEDSNENHILVTYSSYGVNSVWETTNGGTTWTSVENNLPDMPIRWAIFAPKSSTKALLATEVGVWSTDLLNGGSTFWTPTNTNLANVSTYMLKARKADGCIIAATHGRGLYFTNSFMFSFGTFNDTFCQGSSYTFNGQTITTAGTYYDTLVNYLGNDSFLTLKLSVRSLPNAPIGTGTQTFCTSATVVNLTASGTNLKWYTNALGGSPLPNNTPLSNNTNYYATQTVNGCESASRYKDSVIINTLPFITTQPQSVAGCAGNNVIFSVATAGTQPLSYQWKFNGNNVGTNNDTLFMNNISGGNVGYYKVLVSNGCGLITSDSVMLTINAGPSINTQPVAQAVCAGSNPSFSVNATGSSLNFQWKFNGNNIGTNSNTLNLSNVSAGNVGYYKVVISNSCGSVTSDSVQLSLKTSPSIATQPTTQFVCAGLNATYNVTASGAAPLTYQWMFNNSNIGTNANALNVNNVGPGNVGYYKVLISNACGSVLSDSVQLALQTAPNIIMQLTPQNVCVGTNFVLNIGATGTAPLVLQWKLNGNNIGSGLNPFNILNASSSDAGYYKVVVSNVCGSKTSDSVLVTVNGAPVINTQPVNKSTCEGVATSFTVAATSSGSMFYQWKFNGNNIGTNSATLNISNPTSANAGYYKVIITGACGQVTSDSVLLTVNTAPSIGLQPTAQTVCSGSNVNFITSASGTAPLIYQWKFNGNNIGTNSNSLNLNNVTSLNAGNYKVVVSNTCGFVLSDSALLTIKAPPIINGQPTTASVCLSGPVNLTVSVTGIGPFTYVWRHNGTIVGTNSSTYNKVNAAFADSGYYKVQITNSCGSVNSDSVKVYILPSTAITVQPSGGTYCSGGSVYVQVTTNAAPGLNFQWYRNNNPVGPNSSTYNIPAFALLDTGYYHVAITGSCGVVISDSTYLGYATVPQFLTHPAGQWVCTGGTLHIQTSVASNLLATYLWKKNGVTVGSNSSSFHIPNAVVSDSGFYKVIVSNACGSKTSDSAFVEVKNNITPTIAISTASTTVLPGVNVTFTAAASGQGTSPVYQWKKNGVNVGTNSNTYITNTIANGDTIQCFLSNANNACQTSSSAISNKIGMTVNGSIQIDTLPYQINTTNTDSFNSSGVFASGYPGCGGGNADDDKYFIVTKPSSYTNMNVIVKGSSNYDAVFEVLTGTSPSNFVSLGCINASSNTANQTEAFLFTNLPSASTTYIIRVFDFRTGSGSGAFRIGVYTQTNTTQNSTPCLNINGSTNTAKIYGNPTILTAYDNGVLGGTTTNISNTPPYGPNIAYWEGSTAYATYAAGAPIPICGSSSATPKRVWYSFNVPGMSGVDVVLRTNYTATSGGTILEALVGNNLTCPTAFTFLKCSNTGTLTLTAADMAPYINQRILIQLTESGGTANGINYMLAIQGIAPAISLSNATTNSMTVNLPATTPTNLTKYGIYYRPQGSTGYNYLEVPPSTTSYTIPNLLSGVTYQVWVAYYNSVVSTQAYLSETKSLSTLAGCSGALPAPSASIAPLPNTSCTKALIKWPSFPLAGTSYKYRFYYKLATSTGYNVMALNDTFVNLSGLALNADYQFFYKAICTSGTALSGATTLYTNCGVPKKGNEPIPTQTYVINGITYHATDFRELAEATDDHIPDDGKWHYVELENNDVIKENLRLYPNPANDYVLVEFETSEISNASIDLIGVDGKLYYSKVLNEKNGILNPINQQWLIQEKLNLSLFETGNYRIRVIKDGDILIKPLIIIK